jgi:putative protein-disulfide isomerase
MNILHYIYDPFCGWCYAAAPLVKVARELLPMTAHAGGMMAGNRRQRVTPQLRNFVMPHDLRIAQMTGQPFGDAYFEGLLRDEGAVFDSEPPITAMLAAKQLAHRDLDLLARMQAAHFVEGRRIAQPDVLAELAVDVGLEHAAFIAIFAQLSGAATQQHIEQSRQLLARVGGSGFPTLVMEQNDQLTVLNMSAYLGKPDQWRHALQTLTDSHAVDERFAVQCSIDGKNC